MMAPNAQAALVKLVSRVAVVRKWLVALSVLRLAALGLAFAVLYIGGYAVADHYLHFGAVGRTAALAVLFAGGGVLLFLLVRSLRPHVSASAAARHIEGRVDLGQQLQAAIEYYENEKDYPYSKALAEYLVLDVARTSAGVRFDRTVPKWQAHVSAALIAAGLVVAALFMHGNYLFFSTYFARLAHPLANVAPLPATQLVSITGDISAEYGTSFAVEAEIRGRVPDAGLLQVEAAPPSPSVGSTESRLVRPLEVFPILAEGKAPRFTAQLSLEVGAYRYRFTAGDAATDWHRISIATMPKIKSIVADVTLPRSTVIKPYTAEVKDFALQVLKGSNVTLKVTATEPLAAAVVKNIDGSQSTTDVKGGDAFQVVFKASHDGKIRFALESAAGMSNDRIPPLEVEAKPNEPPQMRLISPDGNLLVTDVASVPITFEVTDDFGLKSAAIKAEIAGAQPRTVDIPVEKETAAAAGSYTLELEEYPLNVGDSILVYAEASDIDVGTEESARPVSFKSDIYFIEVRPYRVRWYPPRPGAPRPNANTNLAEIRESLGAILEYTRAIIRKTWALSDKATLVPDDLAKMNSIKNDIAYCVKQLATHKSNPDNLFIAPLLGECIDNFNLAGQYLASYKPGPALDPEKKAYQVLRKLVEEVNGLLPPGAAQPRDMRDRVRVDENVHVKRYDSERVAEQTGQIAEEIAQAADEEQRLQESFDHFLKDEKRGRDYAQKTTDEKSWQDPNQPQPPNRKPSETQSKSGPPARVTVEGAQFQPTPSQSPATSSRPGSARRASAAEWLRMFQARQRALQERVAGLKDDLQRLPQPDARTLADAKAKADAEKLQSARAAAEAEMTQAASSMGVAQDDASRLYSEGLSNDKTANEALRALAAAADHLDNASEALSEYLKERQPADRNLALANELTKLADEYEKTSDPQVKARLLETIKKAQQELGSAQASASVSQSQSQSPSPGSGSGGPGGPGTGFAGQPATSYSMTEPTQVARFLAMRFWTISIQAKKEPSKVSDGEPSSAELYKLENDFFEDAAHYSKGSGAK